MEGSNDYFSFDFYKQLVYDNQVFDIAKLLDLAAIYGRDNGDIVRTIITNVLEADARFVQDFKDAFDMMLTVLKRAFKDARRTDQVILGDTI